MNVLGNIMKSFGDYEKNLKEDVLKEFDRFMSEKMADIFYSALLLIRSGGSDEESFEN